MKTPVICHTSLDGFESEIWPKYMYNPQIGDRVRGKSGRELIICGRTHGSLFIKGDVNEEYLIIELTKKYQ